MSHVIYSHQPIYGDAERLNKYMPVPVLSYLFTKPILRFHGLLFEIIVQTFLCLSAMTDRIKTLTRNSNKAREVCALRGLCHELQTNRFHVANNKCCAYSSPKSQFAFSQMKQTIPKHFSNNIYVHDIGKGLMS